MKCEINIKRTEEIAQEISVLMPVIARRVLLDFFQSVDISQSQFFVIMAIFSQGSCRLSELSRHMDISNPTASGLVDRLVQNGYLKRGVDPQDRRAVSISLSEKGIGLATKFRQTAKTKWINILNDLPVKDQEDYIRILREIRKRTP